MKQFTLGLILVFSNALWSQVTISGKLTDKLGNPVSGASVVITQIDTDNIIAYDISNSKGMYNITFTTLEKEINIVVRSMNYGTTTQTIDNKNQTLNFSLTEEIKELTEVIAKSAPIRKKGDTINYTVSSFSKEQDRSIADVLKRMPGIEVLSDGKVLYQGKPINKYYIEGLDLLEGKYSLANENLPHKEVSKVQILENHQPFKILDSLQFSNNAALNIKLKNTYTFTGQAKIGAGFSPLLWDTNITPLLFTKKQQMLVSYQSNNTGNNVGKQLNTFTLEDLINQTESGSYNQDWLSIQPLNNPIFSESRWLDNNIHLLSGNYLQKLTKDYELRLNISYLNDYQQQNGFTNTQYFTQTDTISLFENKYNQLYFNALETNLTLQKNTKKNYFKNSLQFQGNWNSQRGLLEGNNISTLQNLNNPFFNLSNKLKTIFPAGKQLITLNSTFGIAQSPQNLKVNPGQFKDLLNNGNAYDEVFQKVDLNSFYTSNSIGFTKGWKKFSFSPKIGFQFHKKKLQSKISTSENQFLSNIFSNNLDWKSSKLYFKLKTQFKKNKWRIDFTAPLNLHSYQIKDKPLEKNESLNRITFDPNLYLNYEINPFWSIDISVNSNNQFGTINQLHYAYILQNYRNIKRMNTPLPRIFKQTYMSGLSYRNPIKSLFWSFNYTQINSNNNLLYQSQISENGATEILAIAQDNKRISRNISTRISKYISKLNTNTSLKANYGINEYQEILNNSITNIQNKNWGINGKIEIDITDWLNIDYKTNWIFSKNKIQNQYNKTIIQQIHLFHLNLYPNNNQYISIKIEHLKNNLFAENNKNIFGDILYRYTWKKKNIDFELQWNNIFNTKNYRIINLDAFRYIETNFELRPSQVLFKIRFSL